MKKILSLNLFLIYSCWIGAQNLQLKDHYGKIVNGDTLVQIFHPGTDHGWTEMKIEIYVKNTSSDTIIVGSKKTEYNMQPDEYHAICFGGTCFDSTTFISPFIDPVLPGGYDSTFSGHFRFDDLLHLKSRCLVAYTFYDHYNKNDSAIVYVEYNTMQKAGIKKQNFAYNEIKLYPNPAHNSINISLVQGLESPTQLTLYNIHGATIYSENLEANLNNFTIDTHLFEAGVYYFKINSGKQVDVSRKFVILK